MADMSKSKIKDKIERCKEEIIRHKKYLRAGNRNFTFAKANILILFLETTALQDQELAGNLRDQLEPLRTQLLGNEDFQIISAIRTEHLIHRNKKVNTVYDCSELKEFIKDEIIDFNDLFGKMETYLDQMIDRLDEKNTNEINVSSFFKTKEEIDKIAEKKKETELSIEQVKEYLSKKFLSFTRTDSYSSGDRREIMFEMVVNVIPLLKNLGFNRTVVEYRYMENVKNELIHRFYIFPSDMSRQFELRKYVESMKPFFFKFVFSHKVHQLLQRNADITDLELKQAFSDTLKEFRYVANEFGNQSGPFTFQFIASRLEEPEDQKIKKSEDLKKFISNYVKIMLFYDNECEINRRKRMQSQLPQRYDLNFAQRYDLQPPELQHLPKNYDRPSDMRLYIYQSINQLKKSYKGKSLMISNFDDCRRALKNRCGILKKEFESILDVYVKGNRVIDDGQLIDRIFSDIFTISKIKADKDLKFDEIIDFYENRGSLQPNPGSAEDEFRKIMQGEKLSIKILCKSARRWVWGIVPLRHNARISNDIKEVCTDKFVVNILRLFDSVESQYRNVFNNVEEVFCDQTVLSILTLKEPSEKDWNMLLETKCFAPYAAELIVKRTNKLNCLKLVTYDNFKRIIGNLLENKLFSPQILIFFSLDKTKLGKILGDPRRKLGEPLTRIHYLICESINASNVGNVNCLLKNRTFREVLLDKIGFDSLGQDNKDLAHGIIMLLCSLAQELDRDDPKSVTNILARASSLCTTMKYKHPDGLFDKAFALINRISNSD